MSWSRRSVSQHASVWIPALCLLVGGIERRWIGDDGFINLRVVNQLLSGNGFVFNAGERVEAVTSPLFVLLVAGLHGLGAPLEHGAVWLGLTLSTLGLALFGYAGVISASEPSEPSESVWWLPFGTLAYAAIPAAWDYASAGLENSLGLAWLGLAAFIAARCLARPERTGAAWVALVLGFAPLVRPDGVLLGLPLGGLLLWHAGNWPRRLRLALLAAVPGVLLQLFRMGYYAALVPNTALVKEAFRSYWEQGGRYLWNTLGLYWLLVPLACLLVAFLLSLRERRPQSQLRWALLLGGILHVLFVVRVGGDFMHARLVLPGLAAAFAALSVLPLRPGSLLERAARLSTFALLLGWAGYCASSLRVRPENVHGIGDERGWFARESGQRNPIVTDDYRTFLFYTEAHAKKLDVAQGCPNGESDLAANARTPCDPTLVLRDYLEDGRRLLPLRSDAVPTPVTAVVVVAPLGITAAVLGPRIHVVDALGLADPIGARIEVINRGRPGHEKDLPDFWFAARFAKPASSLDPNVPEAATVLACPRVASLLDAVRAPLTWQRFWNNVRLSFTFHTLRVPRDLREARERLCSPAQS